MKNRDYQDVAVRSFYDYFMRRRGNPLAAMPTGTGKSHVIASFVRSVIEHYPGQRIIMATHVKELIEQNFDKLLKIWPTAPAGVYSAGLGRRDTQHPITFAGIGSVAKRAEEFGHIDLLIIDEAHLVSPRANTMYQQFIEDLKAINPLLKVIGLTATPYRLGLGMLTEGNIFDDVCVDMTSPSAFNWFFDQGYLVPPVPKRTDTTIDTADVQKRGGEFVEKQLQMAVDREEITAGALKEVMEKGHDREHWLIFATGIDHANHIVAMLDSMGVSAAAVHSKMKRAERDAVIRDFKAGRYRAVVNNNVLTTGFDFPAIDLIAVLRPTESPGLWVQMLGRGTRPVYPEGYPTDTREQRLEAIRASGKLNCLVLDFAANTARLGPINDPRIPNPRKGKGGGTAPIKLCELCGTYNHASLRVCMECGAEFPRHVKFGMQAATDSLVKSEEPVVLDFQVDRVTYERHTKVGKPDSIRVTYYCGLRRFKEYVCLEHGGFPARKAREWWGERLPGAAIPETTDEALAQVDYLATPKTIRVWENKKYPEILSHDY